MLHTLHQAIVYADHWLFLLLNHSISNPVFDTFFLAVTEGRFWVIPAIVAALFFIKNEKGKALIAIGLALLTIGITDPVCYRLVKPLFHRLRPCNPEHFIEGGRFLLGYKSSLSFPSAHALNMFAQAALFSYLYPRRWPWFFGFAAMIGFSRIYVGVHYPIDVLGGAIIGFGIGFGVASGYGWIRKRIRRKEFSGGESTPLP